MSIDKFDDVIDSRDVIARIEELKDELEAAHEEANGTGETLLGFAEWLTAVRQDPDAPIHEEANELKVLEDLAEEASGYSSDWKYGESLIRESYFKTYAQELAEDIGAINKDATWPNNCIDWDMAARELAMDYTTVEFDGVDFYIRSC